MVPGVVTVWRMRVGQSQRRLWFDALSPTLNPILGTGGRIPESSGAEGSVRMPADSDVEDSL
jgi:hypothetical protein